MRTTSIRLATHFRQPSIRFLGKRHLPSEPDVPHPHPQAPPDYQRVFTNHSSSPKSTATQSSEGSEAGVQTYTYFWEAPSRLWAYRARVPDEAEMEAIMTGGASSA
ncbi:hypothetical protein NMY22_g4798 [Coprinellus aureogranulatus]|nr:hypothetical protein NMY22_g4798 [Coprinellus aureogranulatus]